MKSDTMLVQITLGQLKELIREQLRDVSRLILDEIAEQKSNPSDDEYATGIKGLMSAMSIGRGRANAISNSPMYASAKMGSGRNVYYNVSEIRRIDSHKEQQKQLNKRIR